MRQLLTATNGVYRMKSFMVQLMNDHTTDVYIALIKKAPFNVFFGISNGLQAH